MVVICHSLAPHFTQRKGKKRLYQKQNNKKKRKKNVAFLSSMKHKTLHILVYKKKGINK